MKLVQLMQFLISVPFSEGTLQNKVTGKEFHLHKRDNLQLNYIDPNTEIEASVKKLVVGIGMDEWRAELRFRNSIGNMSIDLVFKEPSVLIN